jgi:2-isopropylmalate synthase
VHLYNAVAPVMRKVVLGLDEDGIVELATSQARLFVELAAQQPQTQWTFQYSPRCSRAPSWRFPSGWWMP